MDRTLFDDDGNGISLSIEEYTLIAHVRGWCHDGAVCRICKAEVRALQAEFALESVISG